MESSNHNNRLQLIVSSKDIRRIASRSKYKYSIKYKLPMISSYVIEVEREHAESIIRYMKQEENLLFEMDTRLSAQMNRAADVIHLSAAHKAGIYGEGVGVAILDTGIYPHKDLISQENRVIAFRDFVNNRQSPYDDNGHGTHVAGIIGGNGYESDGIYIGVAPRCNIISVKVLNHKGNGDVSDVLAGLQWVIDHKKDYNIRVVNISVGTTSHSMKDESSMLVKGVNAVWDAGIVVVVAAGNNGPASKSISTPGISRKVITVGAFDDDIPVELTGGKSKDYSGRGPTQSFIKKPDIVAPGSNIISCNAQKGVMARNTFSIFNSKREVSSYTTKSGTSMATPIVAGAIALLLSKYPEMTPQDVKVRCKISSTDLGEPWSKQGWGLLNIEELLK